MSQMRQHAVFDRLPDQHAQITTLMRDYPAGHNIGWHFHDRDQLVYASRGVMTIRTKVGTWVVPTHRAVWISTRVPHAITMSGMVAMRTLYFKPRLARSLPPGCCGVNISPLLRELVLQACRFQFLKMRVPWQKHLIEIILDQLKAIQMVPLQLPHLSDPRAIRVTERLITQPGNRLTLTNLCKSAGASKRTLERIIQKEAGMTLGKWRQQLRLMEAVRLLAEGAKVTHAALDAGYNSPSAFISMFRKTLGTTPAVYFRAAGARGSN